MLTNYTNAPWNNRLIIDGQREAWQTTEIKRFPKLFLKIGNVVETHCANAILPNRSIILNIARRVHAPFCFYSILDQTPSGRK